MKAEIKNGWLITLNRYKENLLFGITDSEYAAEKIAQDLLENPNSEYYHEYYYKIVKCKYVEYKGMLIPLLRQNMVKNCLNK